MPTTTITKYDVYLQNSIKQYLCFTAWYFGIFPIHAAPSGNGAVVLTRSGFTSTSYTSGRVQIYYNSRWGNICDDLQFGITEAHVICHQLGYTGATGLSKESSDM